MTQFGWHPDPEIDVRVEIERLEGLLAECRGALESVLTLNVVTPRGQGVKRNIRDMLATLDKELT